MNRLSKGVALTIFGVVTVIALIISFICIDYGYIAIILFFVILLLNFAWMYAWAKQYDKNKEKTITQKTPTFNSITEEVEQWVRQYPYDSSLSNEDKKNLINIAKAENYGYIIAKAARFLVSSKKGYDYQADDFFHYPFSNWNLPALLFGGCNHILSGYGLTPNRCIEKLTPADIRELFELFHFSFLDIEKTDVKNVYKMNFIHKVEGIKTFSYCQFTDLNSLNDSFCSRVWINHRLKPHGINIEKPVLVDVIEKNGIIKICHTDNIFVIAAESAYVFQKYPECSKKLQQLCEIDVNGKPTKADVVIYEFPNGSEKEFVFDISDIKSAFDGFEEELKKKFGQNKEDGNNG